MNNADMAQVLREVGLRMNRASPFSADAILKRAAELDPPKCKPAIVPDDKGYNFADKSEPPLEVRMKVHWLEPGCPHREAEIVCPIPDVAGVVMVQLSNGEYSEARAEHLSNRRPAVLIPGDFVETQDGERGVVMPMAPSAERIYIMPSGSERGSWYLRSDLRLLWRESGK